MSAFCQRLREPRNADERGKAIPCGRPAAIKYNGADFCLRCYNKIVRRCGPPRPIPGPEEPISKPYDAPSLNGSICHLKERVLCEVCGQRFSRIISFGGEDPERKTFRCKICGGSVRPF